MEKKNRSKLLITKIVILIAAVAACLVILAVYLSSMQTRLYLDNFTSEIQIELENLPDTLDEANAAVEEDTDIFDKAYQALAESVAFMANNDAGYAATDEKMVEYRELLSVDNILLVSRDGEILAKAADSPADYSSSRFNQLRTVFEDGNPSEAVEIDLPDKNWSTRYYAARIDDDTMLVIEENPTELNQLIEDEGSARGILEYIVVGQSGYIFTVSAMDFLIGYYPDSSLVGRDALSVGVKVEDLEDGLYTWMEIDGEQLYCGVSLIGDTYYIAAVPRSDMTSAQIVTVVVTVFITFVVLFVILMFGIFVTRENIRKGTNPADVRQFKHACINRVITRRAAILSVVGLVAIVVVSFYMQTLFALSSNFSSGSAYINEVVESIDRSDERISELSEEYGGRYLPVCRVAGYILDENPSLINHADLQDLADTLQIQNIYVYDADTLELEATSSSYTNYTLSEDPESSSFDFIKLLLGQVDYVVQEPLLDEVSGELWQWLGVPLHDENGLINGILQINIHPTILESLSENTDVVSRLENVRHGSTSFAFAINKDDSTFAYLPINEHAEGDSVFNHEITENDLYGGYADYVTIDGEKYFAASAETDDYYIFLASTEDELMDERTPLTIATGVISGLFLLAIFLLLIFEPKRNLREPDPELNDEDQVVQTTMPGGRTIRTDSAASRWQTQTLKWNERTAWQKTVFVFRWLMVALVAAICLAVLFQNQLFQDNSMFTYILGGGWDRGLNIFAVTSCIVVCCIVIIVVAIVQRLLLLLASILNARGETVCRLTHSFLRYGALIGVIFYCLFLIGVNVVTLLASAGIFALAITLGAQSIMSDIISGLFVIFEGEFRVGDIITVGDWRGTVLEIGIRTTKVEDAAQNVKVIRNSDLSNVINMTKKLSFVSVNYAIEYNESLEHVETILARELPKIAERLPAIVKGPYYRGVAAWSDSSIDLRISMQCMEADRFQLERDFNREMRLLFERYDISIPFPQVVVNEPTVQKRASSYEKWLAQEFNDEQKEASKGMGEEKNT